MTHTKDDWRAAALTLLVGGGGAGLFWLIGFPAAVLTGPAAAVSLATVLGLRSFIPDPVRDACFLTLGISIGSTVTPEVLATALTWPLSLVVLTASLLVSIYLVRQLLERGFSFDPMTALLASTPGHLSYVMGLSTDIKADVPRVALVQSIRVLMLTLLVPVLIVWWGAEGTAPTLHSGQIGLAPLLILFVLSFGVGLVFRRWNIPAPFLLGAILISAIGHGSAMTPGALPPWLTTSAFVIMGALIGTRFNGITGAQVIAALAAGVVATLVACIIAGACALLAAGIVGLPPAALLLAFAPGGVEVMAALAIETGLEPAFVAAHHVMRLVILTILIPVLLRGMRTGT